MKTFIILGALISNTLPFNNCITPFNSRKVGMNELNPSFSVDYSEKKVSESKVNFIITRNKYVKVDKCCFKGFYAIDYFTPFMMGDMGNFSFDKIVEKVNEISLGLTMEFSLEIHSGLESSFGINNATIQQSVKSMYKVAGNFTYTTSYKESSHVTVNIYNHLISGRLFRISLVSAIYDVECQEWECDQYWWGLTEVENSRKKIKAYILNRPFVTIEYGNGDFYYGD
ncbi:MAG: hypothetical protein ACTTID_03600 [Bacillales bacterium]